MLDTLFSGGAAWFTVPALIGTGVFLIKLVMMLLGGSDDLDLGGSADAGGAHHADGSGLITIMSVQGVSAFMMGFGWAGLGALQGLGWSQLAAMGVGVGGGVGMCGMFVALLAGTRRLQSSGNVNFQRAKGAEGEVYATVPASGRGQVRLVVDGRQRIVQATGSGEELPTGTPVRVVEVKQDNSVVVRRAGGPG
ncbi:MAG: hypothetical protein LW650_14930 [Planctomycetaceae bacterium]|jgi:hypothetical protein|nr:NfeD family protein [Phycisphaerales bacterium]MCE2654680.1 hypothetical protein [Planctomycetaceae bacterium]